MFTLNSSETEIKSNLNVERNFQQWFDILRIRVQSCNRDFENFQLTYSSSLKLHMMIFSIFLVNLNILWMYRIAPKPHIYFVMNIFLDISADCNVHNSSFFSQILQILLITFSSSFTHSVFLLWYMKNLKWMKFQKFLSRKCEIAKENLHRNVFHHVEWNEDPCSIAMLATENEKG